MNFLAKNFLQFTLVLIFAVIISEVLLANCHYYNNHDSSPIW